jgi:hypothetical protein
MTEQEWLTATDPTLMLDAVSGKVSARRLLLFACACCRRLWDRLDEPERHIVEVSERFADKLTTVDEFQQIRTSAQADAPPSGTSHAASAVRTLASPDGTVQAVAVQAADARCAGDSSVRASERAAQADLLRDIVANPFSAGPPPCPPDWAQDVLSLARAMFEGEPASYALADALLEAGQMELAEHFRAGSHPRGCWAVDVILGKGATIPVGIYPDNPFRTAYDFPYRVPGYQLLQQCGSKPEYWSAEGAGGVMAQDNKSATQHR